MSLADLEHLMTNIALDHNNTAQVPPAVVASILEAVQCIRSGQDRVCGMRKLREALVQTPACIDTILSSGITPVLIHFLHPEAEGNTPELLYEASWALLNLMSGTEEQVVRAIESTDTAAATVSLLANGTVDCRTREHAAWIIANIAATGYKYQMLMLEAGCLPHLINFVSQCAMNGMAPTTAVWALANLADRFAPPKANNNNNNDSTHATSVVETTDPKMFITFLAGLLQALVQCPLTSETVYETIHLMGAVLNDSTIAFAFQQGQLDAVERFLVTSMSAEWDADVLVTRQRQIVTIMGMIASHDDPITLQLVRNGALDCLSQTLRLHLTPDANVKEIELCAEICFALSNIAATPSAFQYVDACNMEHFLRDALLFFSASAPSSKLTSELKMVIENMMDSCEDATRFGELFVLFAVAARCWGVNGDEEQIWSGDLLEKARAKLSPLKAAHSVQAAALEETIHLLASSYGAAA